MILDYVVNVMISNMLKKTMRKVLKQNGEQDRPHFETIGLPLRTHTNSEWPILYE